MRRALRAAVRAAGRTSQRGVGVRGVSVLSQAEDERQVAEARAALMGRAREAARSSWKAWGAEPSMPVPEVGDAFQQGYWILKLRECADVESILKLMRVLAQSGALLSYPILREVATQLARHGETQVLVDTLYHMERDHGLKEDSALLATLHESCIRAGELHEAVSVLPTLCAKLRTRVVLPALRNTARACAAAGEHHLFPTILVCAREHMSLMVQRKKMFISGGEASASSGTDMGVSTNTGAHAGARMTGPGGSMNRQAGMEMWDHGARDRRQGRTGGYGATTAEATTTRRSGTASGMEWWELTTEQRRLLTDLWHLYAAALEKAGEVSRLCDTVHAMLDEDGIRPTHGFVCSVLSPISAHGLVQDAVRLLQTMQMLYDTRALQRPPDMLVYMWVMRAAAVAKDVRAAAFCLRHQEDHSSGSAGVETAHFRGRLLIYYAQAMLRGGNTQHAFETASKLWRTGNPASSQVEIRTRIGTKEASDKLLLHGLPQELLRVAAQTCLDLDRDAVPAAPEAAVDQSTANLDEQRQVANDQLSNALHFFLQVASKDESARDVSRPGDGPGSGLFPWDRKDSFRGLQEAVAPLLEEAKAFAQATLRTQSTPSPAKEEDLITRLVAACVACEKRCHALELAVDAEVARTQRRKKPRRQPGSH